MILYGSESWVVTGAMIKVLEGFHQRADSKIMGMMLKRGAGRE